MQNKNRRICNQAQPTSELYQWQLFKFTLRRVYHVSCTIIRTLVRNFIYCFYINDTDKLINIHDLLILNIIKR